MIVKGKLTLSQQVAGRNRFLFFSLINGVSFTCLADNILILYSLKSGCPDYVVAILASFNFWCNVFMLFGKFLTARYGAAGAFGISWILRNLSALLTASAPLFTMYISNRAGIYALVIGIFGFFSFKSSGTVAYSPLVGEITSPGNRGKFSSRISQFANFACMITMCLIILVMHFTQSLSTYQWIIFTGAISGFISTFFVFRIDETEMPRISACKSIKETFLTTLRVPKYRKMLFAYCCCNSGIMFMIPISMMAIKEGYGISDYNALVFAVVQLAGGIIIASISGVLSEEAGPRPLIIIYFCCMLLLAFCWICAPVKFFWTYAIFLFILGGMCNSGTYMTLLHYFLISVPEKERVGTILFISLVAGVCAGIAGTVISSSLIRYLHCLNLAPLDMYRIYFAAVLIIMFVMLFFVCRLEPIEDWRIGKVLSLVFAPRDIQALYFLNRNENIRNPAEELENIEKLEDIGSQLSEKALLSYLDSPKLVLRVRALQALRQIDFGKNARDAILEELKYGEYATAPTAAQIAGERGIKEAVPLLLKGLDSQDNYFKGRCMLALVQLKEKSCIERIEKIFSEAENPRLVVHGAAALAEIGDPAALTLLLRKAIVTTLPERVRYEIIYSISELSGIADNFYKFLRIYQKDRNEGIAYILDYIEHLNANQLDPAFKKLLESYSENRTGNRELIDMLLKKTDDEKRKIISTIDEFLKSCPSEKLYPEIIYCLVAIHRMCGSV
ncbi:MAG: hypothetical protein A2017_02925 [Lentisphaerae bacterium GWF2_44_16]|nr:MAG: hypothetical protein A2017_02925 [Lentisphaerae bacterium GWF2_44_16]